MPNNPSVPFGMPFVYVDRTTGKIGYVGIQPLVVNPDGSIAVRVTLPNGNPGTYAEGIIDGSVRRGVAGPGYTVPLTQPDPTQQNPGQPIGTYSLPTLDPSDWEMP